MAQECLSPTIIAMKTPEAGSPAACAESLTPWQEITPFRSGAQAWLGPAESAVRSATTGLISAPKYYCSGKAEFGVLNVQSFAATSGTLCSVFFLTTTPCTIGLRPTTPMLYWVSTTVL